MPTVAPRSYIICTTPRSGSTLLCKMLAATGRSGAPDSHFHTPTLSAWLRSYQLCREVFGTQIEAVNAVFAAARKRGTGDTGVFGLRLQRGSFDFFMRQATLLFPGRVSDADRIQAAFGRTLFIHLTRPNKLCQAISWVKAAQTGLWHRAADGTELERLSPPQDPSYDPDEISRHLVELSAMDAAWMAWFKQENLQPLHISYEDLSTDPGATLAVVLQALGLSRELVRGIDPAVTKLADQTNRVWADRFLAEQGNNGAA